MPEKINITLLPPLEGGERIETGPMQFGGDWPGIFMRGDYACMMGMMLQGVIGSINDGEEVGAIRLKALEGLAQTLQSCNIQNLEDNLDGK